MKKCSCCKQSKSFDNFHKSHAQRDGYINTCKKCRMVKGKKYWANMSVEQKSIKLEKNRKYHRQYYKQNTEKVLKRTSEWAKNNRDKKRKATSNWIKANPKYNRFKTKLFKKHIRRATPFWVNMKELRRIYDERPDGMHVDHIIPLRGKNVSGLHVPWNLQYLSAKENLQKHNKFNQGGQ